MTTEQFVDAYRSYFKLDENRITRFDEPSENGCRLFITDSDESTELCSAAIFIPEGVSERDVRQELADRFRTKVSNFDLAMSALAAMPD
jgi:hypothetical protein